MLLVRMDENNKIDAYSRSGYPYQSLALSRRVRKGIKIGPRRVRASSKG